MTGSSTKVLSKKIVHKNVCLSSTGLNVHNEWAYVDRCFSITANDLCIFSCFKKECKCDRSNEIFL